MTTYIILLPPSEGKSGNIPPANPGWGKIHNNPEFNHLKELDRKRLELIGLLQRYVETAAPGQPEKLFELKSKPLQGLDRAVNATRNLLVSPAIPACQLYTGVVYDNIGIDTLPESIQNTLKSSAYVISGLWGIVRLDDMLPDYKLKISAKFNDINISKYWASDVSRLINDITKKKFVWDLLPNEHRKLWVDKGAKATHIASVKFVVESGGKYKVIGHTAKASKGQFVREIATYHIDSLEKLRQHAFANMKITDIITKSNKSEIVMVIG